MGFYTQENIDNGDFKKEKKDKSIIRRGAGLKNESFQELTLDAPRVTKHKQIKVDEIAEPKNVRDKLKVFIDFKFK